MHRLLPQDMTEGEIEIKSLLGNLMAILSLVCSISVLMKLSLDGQYIQQITYIPLPPAFW